MGQIANQMLIEAIFKSKEKLKDKKEEKNNTQKEISQNVFKKK